LQQGHEQYANQQQQNPLVTRLKQKETELNEVNLQLKQKDTELTEVNIQLKQKEIALNEMNVQLKHQQQYASELERHFDQIQLKSGINIYSTFPSPDQFKHTYCSLMMQKRIQVLDTLLKPLQNDPEQLIILMAKASQTLANAIQKCFEIGKELINRFQSKVCTAIYSLESDNSSNPYSVISKQRHVELFFNELTTLLREESVRLGNTNAIYKLCEVPNDQLNVIVTSISAEIEKHAKVSTTTEFQKQLNEFMKSILHLAWQCQLCDPPINTVPEKPKIFNEQLYVRSPNSSEVGNKVVFLFYPPLLMEQIVLNKGEVMVI